MPAGTGVIGWHRSRGPRTSTHHVPAPVFQTPVMRSRPVGAGARAIGRRGAGALGRRGARVPQVESPQSASDR
jgi:hypothetical protein